MKGELANVVLIVSGLNVISEAFHEFPHNQAGLIEIVHERDLNNRVRGACERYCEQHRLRYARVSRANLLGIEQHLIAWQATLVVTHSVPVLPMRLIDPLLHGGINLHHSKLPNYRGGNPLLWQVIEGVPRIGVSVHVLSAGADEGALLAQTEFDRPHAVPKHILTRIANYHYGLDLIKQVIPAWVDGTIDAFDQPLTSPTVQANHFPFEQLLSILSHRAVSLSGLWDVACFLEYWPQESVPATGWCSWFRWVPETQNLGCEHALPGQGHDGSQACTFICVGWRLHLRHNEGCVVFRPQLHVSTLLAKLVL